MSLTQAEFDNYRRQGFNRIPVMREVLADLDTPLSVYLKLANRPYSYLFESVQGGEKWGRYSIIGLSCRTILSVAGPEVHVVQDGEFVERESVADPLEYIRAFKARYRMPQIPGMPRFAGGLVGYFGYDAVRYMEPVLGACDKPDELGTADICLLVSDEVIVFDNLAAKLLLILHVDPAQPDPLKTAERRLDALESALAAPFAPPRHDAGATVREEEFVSAFPRQAYEQAVARAQEYIRAGDIFQVVLAQRMSVPLPVPPLEVYRALRTLNPSPYMFFFNLRDYHIVGSSPEILARLEDGDVTVRPLAGTRRRGAGPTEDERIARELLEDPKELAEHLMLLDLGRNDVGRVAAVGSVNVTERMQIERYAYVMHIVSNVIARVREGLDAIDVLRATFPAGTVSGAPKVRAMQIIDELEPVKRGIYSGAVGYIGWNGNMDTAIALRTAVVKDGRLHIQAGAGIVADSVPASEWEETMNKGRAMFRAVALAAAGLGRAS